MKHCRVRKDACVDIGSRSTVVPEIHRMRYPPTRYTTFTAFGPHITIMSYTPTMYERELPCGNDNRDRNCRKIRSDP
jgi:hypothetical protein